MLQKKYFKTKDECEVTFVLEANEAEKAAVVGEFNGWEPIKMKRAKKAGSPFRIKVRMPKNGEFQFRYLLDGETWINDTAADSYVGNGLSNEENCVVTV